MTNREKQDAVHHANSHALRRRLLEEIAPPSRKQADPMTSPNELAQLLSEPLTNVAYHVRQLQERGMIRLVESEPRRGALEHYYRQTTLGLIAVASAEYTEEMLLNGHRREP